MELKDILLSLIQVGCVSGGEGDILNRAESILSPFCSCSRDRAGNFSARLGSQNAENKILIDAHCDRIGFIVTDILENGFLRVAPVGGIDCRTLFSCRVNVFGKEKLCGVFSSTPPHLQKKGGEKTFPEISELSVDVGLSKERVCELVCPGDRVCTVSRISQLTQNRVLFAGLDNTAGCASAIYAMYLLSKAELKRTCVTLLLTAQEELGMRGAKAAAEAGGYAQAVIVDASFASAPGCPDDKTADIGHGAMLGHSPILSKAFTQALGQYAEKAGIPLQHEIMGGMTGTDADALSLTAHGAECAMLSFPLKNMHSAAEIADLCDLDGISKIISGYIKEADGK